MCLEAKPTPSVRPKLPPAKVSVKDKPFFQSFVQTNAFLAYLQTLHLFGPSKSPFAEAVQTAQPAQQTQAAMRSTAARYILPKPSFAAVSEPCSQEDGSARSFETRKSLKH